MEPKQDQDWREDIVAWARIHCFAEDGEFKGRLEIVEPLKAILMSLPNEREPGVDTLWHERSNKVLWGNHHSWSWTWRMPKP